MVEQSTIGNGNKKFINLIIIGSILFFIFIFVTALLDRILPIWQYFLIALGVLLVSMLAAILSGAGGKISFPGIGGGIGGTLPKIIAGIILVVVVFYLYWAIVPEQEITFCGNDWNKSVSIISAGSWRTDTDSDGNCMLFGSGSIGFNDQIFSAIKIIPAEKSPTDFEFSIGGGAYKAGSGTTETSCRFAGMLKYDSNGQLQKYYDPRFSYNGDAEHTNECVEYYSVPQDITLSRSVTGWERTLQLSIANNPLAEMKLDPGNHRPTTGEAEFYTPQDINIAGIKIYCDMRCQGEKILNIW